MLSSQYNIQQNLQSGYAGIQIFEDINTSADQSVRVGEGAGKLSYGTGNAFVGYQAGEQNLAGSYDTFIGYQAGQLNQNSDSTTLVGAFAGRQNTSGNETVFVGFRAGEFNFNGNQNVGVGAYALRENNSGSSVTAVGWRAAERNLDGDYNTMIGSEAGQNNRSGNYNTMAGYQVGRATFAGSENTFFGAYAGYSNEYGSDNCIIGFKAGLDVTNGNFNIAIGAYSLSSGRQNPNAPSDCNVVIGAFTNTTGSGNVILGLNAGSNSDGDDNVLIGKDVALVYAGHKSVILGANALIKGSGECNTMIGYGIAPNFINGSNNVFIGPGVNTFGTDISYCIAIGTCNVTTYGHSISIGDGVTNLRQETITIGFDINADADNSVLLGKTLNIQNATVFKDPLNYNNIATVATRANNLFGSTSINYSGFLNSPTGTIFPIAGAGLYTSNIFSSSGNPRKTVYNVPITYDIVSANGVFTNAFIHYASSIIVDSYSEFTTDIQSDSLVNVYTIYGSNLAFSYDQTPQNINSYSNLYKNEITFGLSYYDTSTSLPLSNVVTNLTLFGTSNTTYEVYLQKLVQQPHYKSYNSVFANNIKTAAETVAFSITTDSYGNVYMTGLYTSPIPTVVQNLDKTSSSYVLQKAINPSIFVIKYDINGMVIGTTLINSVSLLFLANIFADKNDKIYLTTQYIGTGALSNLNGTPSAVNLLPCNVANACVIQYDINGFVQGAGSIISPLLTSGYNVHTDRSSNIYVTGYYISGSANYNNISITNLDGSTISSKTLITTEYDSANAFLIKYSSNGTVISTASIIGDLPADPTFLKGGAYGRSIYTDIYNNTYLVGDYKNTKNINILQNIDSENENSTYVLPIAQNVTAYIIKYNSDGQINGVALLADTTPVINPITGTIIPGNTSIVYVNGDSTGNVYITGTYLSSSPVPIYNMDGSLSVNMLPPSYDGGIFLIKYDMYGNIVNSTTIDGTYAYTPQSGLNVYCDTFDNVYLAGIYNTISTINLKNLDGSSSEYVFPITQGAAAFIIIYDKFGKITKLQFIDGPGFDSAFGICMDKNNTFYWTGTYLSPIDTPINDINNLETDVYLPASSPISNSAFIIKYTSIFNITKLEYGPIESSINFGNISVNTTFENNGISPGDINPNNIKVRYLIDNQPQYGVINSNIFDRTYLQSQILGSSELTSNITYTPIHEYAFIYSDKSAFDKFSLLPYLQIHNNTTQSNLYGITNDTTISTVFNIQNNVLYNKPIVRNAIIFNSDNTLSNYVFTSNDFQGVPFVLSDQAIIQITGYDTNHFNISSNIFSYLDVKNGAVYISQSTNTTEYVAYAPITGTLTDTNIDNEPFTIQVSSIPINLYNIIPSYSIELSSTDNSVASVYNLPNIQVDNLWVIQASSNSDLQIPSSAITNLNQGTYRRINPFVTNDSIRIVVQKNALFQELYISFSNTPNYIYHTLQQSVITRPPIVTNTNLYQLTGSILELLPIQNTYNIYTSNLSINLESETQVINSSSYSYYVCNITTPYDNTYGYSNLQIFDSISNVYPINKENVGSSNGEITINYINYASNYLYPIGSDIYTYANYDYTSNVIGIISNTDNSNISYTSNIVRNTSNLIFLSQASNYTYSRVTQEQNSFYDYGLINTYNCLLLRSSNTSSNQSARNVSSNSILIESVYTDSGTYFSSNLTSNLLVFNELRTSNSVLPITRATTYRENGAYTWNVPNGFQVWLLNQGIVNYWSQDQIDSGSVYLQLPPNSGSDLVTNTYNIIQETTTSSILTTDYVLYNAGSTTSIPFTPNTCNVYTADRYTFGGKTVRGIYNINHVLDYLNNRISTFGFVPSKYNIVYLDNEVNVLLLNSSLAQTTSINASGNAYLARVNSHKPLVNIQLFATDSTGTLTTNIFTIPIIFNDLPQCGIPLQGFNYGISVGKKNILDPEIFYHSWDNLPTSNLSIQITSTLTNASYQITSNGILLTDANKNFTYQDCRTHQIAIQPLTSSMAETIVYDLINGTNSSVISSGLTYNIASYEFYPFPSTYEILDTSLTTVVYGSQNVANVFTGVLASYVENYYDSTNTPVSMSDICVYIETPPENGVFYDKISDTIQFKWTLDKPASYLSYTPNNILHDSIDVRITYKTTNISPIYSIPLSNYAVPIINLPVEVGNNESILEIQSFVRSSENNINKYLQDGNSFIPNYITVPLSDSYPLSNISYPIQLVNNKGKELASTTLLVEPFALSAIPVLNAYSITIDVNQYSVSSLKPLLGILKNTYKWNNRTEFVLTIPSINGFSVSTEHGVIMKKSYISGQLQLVPISHFTNNELQDNLIVYLHIGTGSSEPESLTDNFTCYATNGEYAYNKNLITVTLNIHPLPYVSSISDDYVYYNTIYSASNTVNPLTNSIEIQTIDDNTSLSILSTSNVDVINTATNTIVNVFSLNDLKQEKIGYRIRSAFLNNYNFMEQWPFKISFSPNGLSNVSASNELINIPEYRNMFVYDFRGTLNIYESDSTILYPPIINQELNYTFNSDNVFGINPVNIIFELKPVQPISTIGMTYAEAIDSDLLRSFEIKIQLGTTYPGNDIFDAILTSKSLTIYEPYYLYKPIDGAILFEKWNTISILSTDANNNNYAIIQIGSIEPIELYDAIDTTNLKSISIIVNETSQSNVIYSFQKTYNTNPYGGDLPIMYDITNYATSLYLRNFEIDVLIPFNVEEIYDPTTANVVIGKNVNVKGTDNIAIGKEFSTSGKNNIIIGNYIGVDPTTPELTNDIYESIVIGNNSFISGRIENIIAIGNSNLNDLANVVPEKINEFISRKPIIIGNDINANYIDYNINIGNTFLRTDIGNSQVYIGVNNEKVAIGYNYNQQFTRYQDLYVARGIAIGTTDSTPSTNYALDIVGNINISGNIYQNNESLLNTWHYKLNQYNSNAKSNIYINNVQSAISIDTTGYIYFNSITSDADGNTYILGSYNRGVPFNITLFNMDGTPSTISLPSTQYGFTSLGTTCIIKYDSPGNVIGCSIIDNFLYDSGKGICTDNAGNIYITGYYQTGYQQDWILNNIDATGTTKNTNGYVLKNNVNIGSYIVKYDPNGLVSGATSINSYFTSNTGNAICSDGTNIYAAGDYNSFVLDPNTFQPPNPYAPIPLPVALSNLQGTPSIFYLPGTTYQQDGYIIKYNENGNVTSTVTIIGTGLMPDPLNPGNQIGKGTASILSTCTDAVGNLYIAGTYTAYTNISLSNLTYPNTVSGLQLPSTIGIIFPSSTPVAIPAALLIKYNASGIVQCYVSIFSQIVTNTNNDNRIIAVHVDIQGNIYIAGTYIAPVSPILTYNLNGTPSSITLSTTQSQSGFFIKYDSNGYVIGAITINGTGYCKCISICSDSLGYVYVTGIYNSSYPIQVYDLSNPTNSKASLPSATNTKTYVLKYAATGELIGLSIINANSPTIQNTINENTLSIYCDKISNSPIKDIIQLTGTYSVNQTINLYNIDIIQSPSSYALPAYNGSYNKAYIIRYSKPTEIIPSYDYNVNTIYVGSGSNVGIGTSFVPYDVTLYVNGYTNINDDTYVSGTLTASNLNFTGLLLQNGVPYIGSQWTTNGNDIYYNGGSVGIKKIPTNVFSLDVSGNINFTGNIYQNGILYPLGGMGGYGSGSNTSNIWVQSLDVASIVLPGIGSISYSPLSNSIFRHCDNDIEYCFDLTFSVINSSSGIGDYKLSVPFEVDTSYYIENSVIGSAWSTISFGSLSNHFPVSIRSPSSAHQSNVIIRFVNGATETSFSELPSGTTVRIGGMFNYVSTSILPTIGLGGGSINTTWINTVYGIYNSNYPNVGIGTSIPNYTLDVNGNINFTSNLYQRDVLIDLTTINIATSNINKVNPWINTPNPPSLVVPSPGTFTYSSTSNAVYRHIDNDVEYAFNLATIITQASGVGDYKLSLPVPYNSNYYTPNTIIGSVWSRVISGGISNYLPVSVSTTVGGDSNYMTVRFINGTTETPMSVLSTGSTLQISGSIDYVAPVYPRSGIFLSNVCYQDDYGHVGFNTFGPLQGQVDIVTHETGRPSLYVENTTDGPLALFVGTGNIGIGTLAPREKLDIVGNVLVSSNIGIGLTAPSYQLQLSLDSAAKPTTNTWTVSSDIRVKEDILNADLDRCYQVVKDLRLCRFRWNSNYLPDVSDKHMLGWIAQEVEPFIPNAITRSSNYGIPDMYGLDSDQIIKFMYGTIQKNIQTIERQEQIISTMSENIARLEAFIVSKFEDYNMI